MGAADLLPRLAKRGVVCAGGLHTAIKGTYPSTYSSVKTHLE